MSTQDLVVANDTMPNVRSDINANLQALGSQMSGTADPATMYAYERQARTDLGIIRRRNAANSGWVIDGTLAETYLVARSSNTMLAQSDHQRTFVCISTFTQTLTAAATLGDGWMCRLRNDGTGVITIDPNGSETIDGATTLAVLPGQSFEIHCDGSNFKTVGLHRRFATVSRSSDTVLAAADHGKTIVATGTWTQTLTAAATLGDGWMVNYRNDGSGTITLDANASETIDGAATKALTAGQSCVIICDGSNFKTVGLSSAAGITLGTPQTSTSGTAIDFTSIPSGTRRITINFSGDVSSSGTSNWLFQIGDSGGIESTSYVGAGSVITTAVATAAFTTGFGLNTGVNVALNGSLTLTLVDAATNTWAAAGIFGDSNTRTFVTGGSKSLSASLDRVRITTSGGADTFDSGKINITYE